MTIGIVAVIAIAAVGMFMIMNKEDGGSDVKPISLDGVDATEDNVLNGTYPIQRNLILCTNGAPTGNVKCFIDWITSDEGQAIVAEEFVPLPAGSRTTFIAPVSSDDIVVGGSTSIQATMTKLAAAYKEKYNINVSVSGGGSGVGASGTVSGQFDIGIRQVGHPADIHVFGAEKCGHVGSVDIDLGIGNHGSLADRNADGVEYAALEHVVSRHFETNFAFTGLANSDEFDMVVAGEGIGKTVSPGDVAGDGALRCRGKRHKECGKKSKDSVHKFLLIYKYRCIILLFVPFESRMPQAFPAE